VTNKMKIAVLAGALLAASLLSAQTLSVPSGGIQMPNVTSQSSTNGVFSCASGSINACQWIDYAGGVHSFSGGGGGGNFNGPGSSVVNDIVGFADTTGHLGYDTGVRADHISTAATGTGPLYQVTGAPPTLTTIGSAGGQTGTADISQGDYASEVANDGTTGTTLNELAKATQTGAILTATTDSFSSPASIVMGGAGTTGNAQLAVTGIASCIMDVTASNTEGQPVFKSVTGLTAASGGTAVAGECSTTTGANVPLGTYILGKLISNSTTAGSTALVIVRPSWFGQVPTGRAVTSSPDTILNTDCQGGMVTYSSTSAIAVTLPQAGTTGFSMGCTFYVQNLNTGTVTITPTTSAIYYNAGLGTTSLALTQGQGAIIRSMDGVNYSAVIGGSSGSSAPLYSQAATGLTIPSTITLVTNTGTGCASNICTMTTPASDGTYRLTWQLTQTTTGSGGTCTTGSLQVWLYYTDADTGAAYSGTIQNEFSRQMGSSLLQSMALVAAANGPINNWVSIPTEFRAKGGVAIRYAIQATVAGNCTTPPIFAFRPALYGPLGY